MRNKTCENVGHKLYLDDDTKITGPLTCRRCGYHEPELDWSTAREVPGENKLVKDIHMVKFSPGEIREVSVTCVFET